MMTMKNGFTVVELMVTVVVTGILSAIAIPNYMQSKYRAQEALVKANMHVTQIAVEEFSIDAEGFYPKGKDTQVKDVLTELGYQSTDPTSLADNKVKGPFGDDAFLPNTTSFRNPFDYFAPLIKDYNPPAHPPAGCMYYTGFSFIGKNKAQSSSARGYSIAAFGHKTRLSLILSNWQ